jgi:hypothetical protein
MSFLQQGGIPLSLLRGEFILDRNDYRLCGTLPLGGTPVLRVGSFTNQFMKVPDYPHFLFLKMIL